MRRNFTLSFIGTTWLRSSLSSAPLRPNRRPAVDSKTIDFVRIKSENETLLARLAQLIYALASHLQLIKLKIMCGIHVCARTAASLSKHWQAATTTTRMQLMHSRTHCRGWSVASAKWGTTVAATESRCHKRKSHCKNDKRHIHLREIN